MLEPAPITYVDSSIESDAALDLRKMLCDAALDLRKIFVKLKRPISEPTCLKFKLPLIVGLKLAA